MKVVAFVPIKLNNERVPGKNTKPFSDGTPLMTLIQRTLLKADTVDEVYVYCSQERVKGYILPGVNYLKRDEKYDTASADVNDMFYSFSRKVPADIYVLAHATAPFLRASSVDNAVRMVASGEYDSAIAVRRMMDFFWQDEKPLNYDTRHIPRTQDLEPMYMETTGMYVFTKDVIEHIRSRIGARPYLQEVSEIEATDINNPSDFEVADAIHSAMTRRRISVLDCTLRDGGYCNQWRFGFDNAKTIVNGLVDAGVDIIECGFLTNKVTYDPDVTKFTTLQEAAAVIPEKRAGRMFVVMMNYGEYVAEDIPVCDGSSVDGIRVAFHKKDLDKSINLCKKLVDKGYKVFLQPMVSLGYTDEEFLDLIRKTNAIHPYAFYIVDSFGMMKSKDLIRLFYMVEHDLDQDILIGFHSHNNMQLAYSNAQSLLNVQTSRSLVIDSSVYGMGRGAGNLNTELFVGYLNENYGTSYELRPLLAIIDKILNEFYQRDYWGYSLPNYISAAHNAHPNYAGYLDDKKTLTVEAMNELFDEMAPEKRWEFDKKYIENLYIDYMGRHGAQRDHTEELKEALAGRRVLLIAPGKNSYAERERVIGFIQKNDPVVMSVNFNYNYAPVDYIFLSNLRRYEELEPEVRRQKKCISTSNITAKDAYLTIGYRELLNDIEAVRDNAGLMAIKMLIGYGVSEIYLAGFDGYSHDLEENYGTEKLTFFTKNAVLDSINAGFSSALKVFSKSASIKTVTSTKYQIEKETEAMNTNNVKKPTGGGYFDNVMKYTAGKAVAA